MSRTRPFILLGVAIVIALLTTFLIYTWLSKKTVGEKVVALKTKQVVVSKVDLPWGTVLSGDMVEVKPFLSESVPPGSFPNAAAVDGRVLRFPIGANELVLESRLAPAEGAKGGGIAAVVSHKKRAMAIKVDKVVGVSGFVFPGDRVDVYVTLHTQQGQQGEAAKIMTKLVLENMLVLTAGSRVEDKDKKEKQTPVDVITLEVTPEEGEKLALASSEGKVVLALRNYTDTESIKTSGTTIPNLLSSLSFGINSKTSPIKRNEYHKKDSPKHQLFYQLIQGNEVISQKKYEWGE
jgi:pilus assembly protein CpaB